MTWETVSKFFSDNPWLLGSGGIVALLALLWTVFGRKKTGHSADNGGVVNTGTANNISTNKPK
jgi:hypothetical protein